jgi:hypothetical protein
VVKLNADIAMSVVAAYEARNAVLLEKVAALAAVEARLGATALATVILNIGEPPGYGPMAQSLTHQGADHAARHRGPNNETGRRTAPTRPPTHATPDVRPR